MKFDRRDLTWKYSDSGVADQPVMTFLDDDADQVRVHTATGYADLATADLGDRDALAAKLAGCGAEAFACADRSEPSFMRKPGRKDRAFQFPSMPAQTMFAGSTHLSKSSALTCPRAMAASFSVVPSLCAFLAISAAL